MMSLSSGNFIIVRGTNQLCRRILSHEFKLRPLCISQTCKRSDLRRSNLRITYHQNLISVPEHKYGTLSKISEYVSNKIYLLKTHDDRRTLAYELYHSIESIDQKEFHSVFQLPDTFLSWFVIVELHVWMFLCTLMDSQRRSIYLRDMLIKALWHDVEVRIHTFENVNKKALKKQFKLVSTSLQFTLWTYDEGLLDSDISLANALWYKFFNKKCPDPRLLEVLVRYIRHQLQHLSTLNLKDLKSVKELDNIWLPLKPHVVAVMENS